MKIGMIAKSIDPRDGGLERHILELSNALVEEGHDVTVFVRENHVFEDAKADIVEVSYRDVGQDVLNTYFSYRGFYSEIKKRVDDFDVIHGHALEPFSYVLGKKLRRFETPFVYTMHGVGSEHVSRKWLKPAAKVLHLPERSNVYSADGLIAVSRSTRDEAIEHYGLDVNNIEVINNGVDLKKFSSEWSFDNKILFVGHLISRKGPQVLLDAFDLLENNKELELIFVGSGRLKDQLVKSVKEQGLKDQVVFKEDISEEELIDLYSESIFCMPSAYEGFGMVYVEAMACGAPVIATEGTAIDEVIAHEKNGILSPRDPDVISEHLNQLMEDEDYCKKMSQEAKSKSKEFSWENIALETADYYKEIIEKA